MNDVGGPYELPEGWEWTRIEEIALVNYRDPALRDLPDDLPITFVPMASVDAEKGVIAQTEERPLKSVRKGFTPFSEGDVLFAKITPSMENGKSAIALELLNGRGFGSTEFHVLNPENGVLSELLLYFVRQETFRREAKANFAGTAGQLRVPPDFLRYHPFPLPPFPEQRRIVARIVELFTPLDAGVSALETSLAQLKRYRQSVLKAAVEGRLTEYWRREHSDVEPASELLERILKERRAKWEENELAKMAAKGKRPKNDRWKQKYKEPQVPETEGLPELPEGWMWAELNTVCQDITDGDHQAPPKSQEGVPFLVISNIREGKLDFDNTRFVPRSYYEAIPLIRKPVKGDILYSLVGSYGFPVIVDIEKEFCFQRHIGLIRPNKQINIKYLFYFLKSHLAFNQATKVATGTAQLTVPLSGLRRFNVPLPPIAEQHEIVSEIERRLSVADQTEATTAANLRRAARLRQSILKKAFRGELVPQDPDDEPASALLEMIRTERAKTQPKKRRGRPRKKKTTTQTELI